MKKSLLVFLLIVLSINLIFTFEKNKEERKMKLNAGIITNKLAETKKFYVQKLGFEITFESEWFLLLNTPGGECSIAFMLPKHPTQKPIFQSEFGGKGVFITIEVANVDAEYEKVKKLGIPIEVEIRDEEWGDRHFAVVDPNGIGVDFVTNKLYD